MTEAEKSIKIRGLNIPVFRTGVLIAGSGAASLSCALHLRRAGIEDLVVVTDNLNGGTSRNTGSDKQTYYKLSDSTPEPDSPYKMAATLSGGGCMHGDIALVEALCSPRAFYNLVNIGVSFPHNEYGGYTCYKTDHDPSARGTSSGPFTSGMMTECLLKEARRYETEIIDSHDIIRLLSSGGSVSGAVVLDKRQLQNGRFGLKIILADYVVFGLGGPAGLYEASVYPKVHTGGIGLALEIGAEAVNLTESQFGIASAKPRWNLSGSYQQVIPSYYSTDNDGKNKENFLQPYFTSMRAFSEAVFLKGYQWPFDSSKVAGGSSLIDLLIYIEKNIRGRRVFMDFMENPAALQEWDDFGRNSISAIATEYLDNSGAWDSTPFKRLKKLNRDSIELYRMFGIDLETEAVEIDVCAQHNNGGLAGDIWWESTNIKNLFPVGEINGTHGISRPGGSALNSGQVGALRAAEKIAARKKAVERPDAVSEGLPSGVRSQAEQIVDFILTVTGRSGSLRPEKFRDEFRHRMSVYGGMVREHESLNEALKSAKKQLEDVSLQKIDRYERLPLALKNRHMVLAHYCYLAAIEEYLQCGGGSRGSGIILDVSGNEIHEMLDSGWKFRPEAVELRQKIQVLRVLSDSTVPAENEIQFEYRSCRGIPSEEYWFENVWSEYKKIYGPFKSRKKQRK